MVKYSSILLIASMWIFTVLCISAASNPASNIKAEEGKDYFNGDLKTFFDAFSDITTSSNEFVKFLREGIEKCFAMFDKDKKEIQDAVKEGTEMEKKIQDILTTLKNFSIPLPKELQSEIDTIGETAAAELTKLKGMDKVDDIEAMKTKYKKHYETIRTQIEDLSKIAATLPPVSPAAAKSAPAPQNPSRSIQMITTHAQKSAIVAQTAQQGTEVQAAKADEAKEKEMETKLFELMKAALPVLRSAEADEETISGKFRNVYTTVSKIRHELIKAERIQFHLLRSQNQFKTDAAPSVRSSMAQFAIAIMFGMLF